MHRGIIAALAGAAIALAGCSGGGGIDDDGTWPHTSDPVDADGLVWASGSTVHLPDGSTIDTGERPAGSYVVAGPGVWFASAQPDELEGNDGPELRLATADGVEDLGAHPHLGTLTTSVDGQWLAFIDRAEGGSGPAEAVVVDTTTGEEVVRSGEGLLPSETEGTDWTDLYEDAPVGMFGVVDDTAYVQGLSTLVAWDLTTGEATVSDLDWSRVRASAWFGRLHRPAPLANADGSWSIGKHAYGATPVLESSDGERVTTRLGPPAEVLGLPDLDSPALEEWTVGGWLDDLTAVGLTPSRDGYDSDWNVPALITCTVPTGACALVEGTEEGVNLPTDRPVGLPSEATIDPSG